MWPASCRRRAVSTCTRLPMCRLGAVGSAHVEPHAPLRRGPRAARRGPSSARSGRATRGRREGWGRRTRWAFHRAGSCRPCRIGRDSPSRFALTHPIGWRGDRRQVHPRAGDRARRDGRRLARRDEVLGRRRRHQAHRHGPRRDQPRPGARRARGPARGDAQPSPRRRGLRPRHRRDESVAGDGVRRGRHPRGTRPRDGP